MDMAIIGAGGSVGRQITQMVVSERLIEREEHLFLVGHEDGESEKSLLGFTADLQDAYEEICPHIAVTFDIKNIKADLIIMAAGDTIPVSKNLDKIDRDMLARHNLPVFKRYASALAENGNGSEIVICVSNPNELAVACFAKYLDRQRVIGMGAFLDSWRFRKEIAKDLNIHRQKIHGYMIGEHGTHMIPLWSSIHIHGYNDTQLSEALKRIRKGFDTSQIFNDCKNIQKNLYSLILKGKIHEAYAMIEEYPPDIRTILKPFITHFSGSKTIMGTAKSTLAMLRMIALGNDTLVTGQIKIEGEFHGIESTIGVPFVIGNKGVDRIIDLPLTHDEEILLCETAENVNKKIKSLL